MNNLSSTTYELVDTLALDKYIPSKLYGIKPITKNNMESLTSYINRIACEHNTSTRKLIKLEFIPYISSYYENNRAPKYCTTSARLINGATEDAEIFIKLTEKFTQQSNLSQHTLSKWKYMIPKGPNKLLNIGLSWCPYCFQQMKNENKIIYEHLSWTLSSYYYCTEHKQSLSTMCPNCNRKQPMFSDSRIGHCYKCYTWLGEEYTDSLTKFDTRNNFKLGLSHAVNSLVNSTMELNHLPTQDEFVQILFSKVETLSHGNIPKFSRDILGLDSHNIYQWLKRINIPSFNLLLYTCMRLGETPTEFFNNNAINQELILQNMPSDESLNLRVKIKSSLQVIYSKSYNPISLQGIAKKLGVSVEYLRFNFYDETKDIRHKYYNKTAKKKKAQSLKLAHIKDEIDNIICDLITHNIKPSKSKVARLFKGKINFKDIKIKETYDKSVKRYSS